MPTYEYACDACDHEFEREQRITDKPIRKCPECGKLKARRMIGGSSFILKGGGWYSDLYSGASNQKAGSDSSKASGAVPSPSDAKKKASTKPAASEAKPSKAAKAEKAASAS